MDTALQAILSWQFVLFSLSIATITYVIRIVVDYCLKAKNIDPKRCIIWTDLFLPLMPVFLGSLAGYIAKQYPYPVDISSVSGRLAFGLCAGMISGLIWRVVKSMLVMKIGPVAEKLPDAPVVITDVENKDTDVK